MVHAGGQKKNFRMVEYNNMKEEDGVSRIEGDSTAVFDIGFTMFEKIGTSNAQSNLMGLYAQKVLRLDGRKI